jgi:3-phosphoshikimate 1-carboxyvinyltransferase
VSNCPDLFPPLALLAALRKGLTTNIGGAARLRLKECDRISAVCDVLSTFGVRNVEEFADGISVVGVGQLKGNVTVNCHNDHRIAMMAAMAATCAAGPVTLVGAECVAKSYPNFWEDYEMLGGQIVRED